jgi:starch synthase
MSHTQPFTTSSVTTSSANSPGSHYVKASLLPFNSPSPPLEQLTDFQQTQVKLEVESALRGAPLRVLIIASEGVPYVKTGGPADVIGALPQALRRLGHDVRVVLPRYNSIDPERWHLCPIKEDLPVPIQHTTVNVRVLQSPKDQDETVPFYFIEAPHYFQREKLYGYNDDGDRFILFCRAALEFARSIGWSPDIIHCHDWHTAIIPNWMKTIYKEDPQFAETATVYTIHNLAYQGIFGYRILEVAGIAEEGFVYHEVPELANVVDLMGRGILFADVVSTVSPRYASEILTPEFGERLDPLLRARKDRLYGILNGIDTTEYNPATDMYLISHYDAFSLDQRPANKLALQERTKLPVDPHIPLIGIISRLSDQKGFDLLDQIAIPLIEQGVQVIVSGTGDQHYHSMFQRLAARYPQQVSIHLTFNQEISQQIYSGSDMLLMPSRFEPCGSTQMLAMRYGSIPIVHRTGGLADTVQDFDPINNTGNGFSFSRYHPFHLFAAVMKALEAYQFTDAWRDLMQRAMLADYSWDASAEQYVALYRRAQELQHISASRG